MHSHRLGLILLICAAASSCVRSAQNTADANDTAHLLATLYASAPAFTADMRIIVRPPETAMLSFDISLWADREGRLRISCKKFNLPFLEGLIESDGSFRAELVREQAVIIASLDDLAQEIATDAASGAAVFSELLTISHVLRHGPLVGLEQWQWEDGAEQHLLSARMSEGLRWQVLTRGRRAQQSRVFCEQQGRVLFTIDYSHERDFPPLHRAQGMQLDVDGDASRYLFRLRRIEVVPSISQRSLALGMDPGWRHMELAEFLTLLTSNEDAP